MNPAEVKVEVGEPPSGPTVENETEAPDESETAVRADSLIAVVRGVAYLLVTLPTSVTPVSQAPAVCAHLQFEIVLNDSVNLPNWHTMGHAVLNSNYCRCRYLGAGQ